MQKQKQFLNKKGVVLITTFLVIVVLAILSIAMISRLVTDSRATWRYKESVQAFYAAEAAIDRAIAQLPANIAGAANVAVTDTVTGLVVGRYSLAINVLTANEEWSARSTGFVPDPVNPRAQRTIEAFLAKRPLPDGFWDYAIYTSGDITLNGVANIIDGDVIYAGVINPDPPVTVTGTDEDDPTIDPLQVLDFAGLRDTAVDQGNVYTQARIDDPADPFPGSFWFIDDGVDGVDNDGDGEIDEEDELAIPNVVYVEANLVLRGNIGTIGGFFVVVGDVITDPTDTTIKGCGVVDGCIYTTGTFTVNGGGGADLNVNGGVWTGGGATINGSVNISHNQEFMDAIEHEINPSPDIQMISWREE